MNKNEEPCLHGAYILEQREKNIDNKQDQLVSYIYILENYACNGRKVEYG